VLGTDSGQEVTSLKASAQATEAHKPPSAPSTVFLGESGVRGVRPNDLPAQHALCCFTVKHHTRSHGVYGHVSMKQQQQGVGVVHETHNTLANVHM
jgi:hypothetical protein